jgi:hypothetical protein
MQAFRRNNSPLDRGLEGMPEDLSNAGTSAARAHGGPSRYTDSAAILVLPLTVKWARLFFCQQSSVEAVQTGTSLP